MKEISINNNALQEQVIQSLGGLSDENLEFLLEFIGRFMKPDSAAQAATSEKPVRKIGICKPDEIYAPDYDLIHGDNDYIAEIFGVNEE